MLCQARAARDALAHGDALRAPMDVLLQHAEPAVQGDDNGRRPTLPDRGRFLNKLSPSNASRPVRAAAFAAMDALVACAWPTMSANERKRKERAPANADRAREDAAKFAAWEARWLAAGCDEAIEKAKGLHERLSDAVSDLNFLSYLRSKEPWSTITLGSTTMACPPAYFAYYVDRHGRKLRNGGHGAIAKDANVQRLYRTYGEIPWAWPPEEQEAAVAPLHEGFFDRVLAPILDELAALVDPGPYICGDADSLGCGAHNSDEQLSADLRSLCESADFVLGSRTLADVLSQYPSIVRWLKRIPNGACECGAPSKRWNAPHQALYPCSELTRSFCAMLGPFDPDWGYCRDGCSCRWCIYPYDKWECGGYFDLKGNWINGLNCRNCKPHCGRSVEEIKRIKEEEREQQRLHEARMAADGRSTTCTCTWCACSAGGPKRSRYK